MANIMTLALDPETRDLMFDADGMLQCVYDGEAIAQNIRNNLHTWKGEFPLNTAHGTDWERVVGDRKARRRMKRTMLCGPLFSRSRMSGR